MNAHNQMKARQGKGNDRDRARDNEQDRARTRQDQPGGLL